MDSDDWKIVGVIAALVAFNGPILVAAVMSLKTPNLRGQVGKLLKEKDSAGDATDSTSFSRVVGAVGTVMVASLFWVVSNVGITTSILHSSELTNMVSGWSKLFLVGAALYVPYAFNQLKSVLQ